jgi:hypothetical protein
MADSQWPPQDLRTRLSPAGSPPVEADERPLDRHEAEARASDDNEWTRVTAAADPRLPVDLVARLAVDPSYAVRLAVSMRPELSEQQRAAIEYHVGPDDRIRPARWVTDTRDPELQRRCVFSAHIGLRRSAARNPLFDDPPTAGAPAANPHLPVPVMHRVLADGAALADEVVDGKPAAYLGRWSPDQLPPGRNGPAV